MEQIPTPTLGMQWLLSCSSSRQAHSTARWSSHPLLVGYRPDTQSPAHMYTRTITSAYTLQM